MSSVEMQNTIYNDSTVQSLVGSFLISSTTYYMVFDGLLIPDEIPTDSGVYSPTVKDKTVNHFDVTTYSGATRLVDRTRQVSCRAYTQSEAEDIRDAVFIALNKTRTADGKAYFVCSVDPIMPPTDKTDNYNAPLSVRTLNLKC